MRLLLELKPTLDRNFVPETIQFAIPKLIRFLLSKSESENLEKYQKDIFKYLSYNIRITPKPRTYNNSLLVGDKNIFSIIFSSYNEEILNILNDAILKHKQLLILNVRLGIVNIELQDDDVNSEKIKVRPLAPILSGEIKAGNKFPFYYKWKQEEFLKCLENNLINEYKDFFELEELKEDETINIIFDKNYIRYHNDISQLVQIYKRKHRAVWAPLYISGSKNLIKFALDRGIGINKELGYGLLEAYTPKVKVRPKKRVDPKTLPDNFGNLIENNPLEADLEIDTTNYNK